MRDGSFGPFVSHEGRFLWPILSQIGRESADTSPDSLRENESADTSPDSDSLIDFKQLFPYLAYAVIMQWSIRFECSKANMEVEHVQDS